MAAMAEHCLQRLDFKVTKKLKIEISERVLHQADLSASYSFETVYLFFTIISFLWSEYDI